MDEVNRWANKHEIPDHLWAELFTNLRALLNTGGEQ